MDDQHAGFEVEVKFRVADHAALAARLAALGAVAGEPIEQEDLYLAHPARDFARTDEALRVRHSGSETVVTYKGPKRAAATKTRTEIELPLLAEPEQAVTLFTSLGYRPVAVVTKTRQTYRLSRGGFDMQACLDNVGPVGRFVELEILADEAAFESAQAVLLATAAELGLREQERRSYLGLTLEQR
jgi:adenylate cyclase class 2